jgi:glucose-1-phosphate thymidylyltransferase
MKGQSDAFWQARDLLDGPMLMAFSDTLIENDFSFLADEEKDAVAFVKPVPDPRRFGVADVNEQGKVTKLVEKPQDMSNNLAVVGCYYFEQAEALLEAIEEQIDRDISLEGEYYLADALNILLDGGLQMRTEQVAVWLDAGTPEALLDTNQYLLEHGRDNSSIYDDLDDTIILPPVNIHPKAQVSHSILGPNLAIGEDAIIKDSTLRDSIIGPGSHITSSQLNTSIIGHNTTVTAMSGQLHLGDDSRAIG